MVYEHQILVTYIVRCTEHNGCVSKRGALKLLECIAEAIGAIPKTSVLHVEASHCQPCENVVVSKVEVLNADDVLEFSSGGEEGEDDYTTKAIVLPDGSNITPYNDSVAIDDAKRRLAEISPTKQRRQLTLKKATIRNSGKKKKKKKKKILLYIFFQSVLHSYYNFFPYLLFL